MSRSIADAVQTDGQILREASSHEAIVARDLDLARQLDDGAELSTSNYSDVQLKPQLLDDEDLLAKLQILYVSGLTERQRGLGDLEGGTSNYASSCHKVKIMHSALQNHIWK